MANSARFRTGSGCYVCSSCGKKTRATGNGEESCGLCFACYEEAGWENTHSDYAHDKHPEVGLAQGCPICKENAKPDVKPDVK